MSNNIAYGGNDGMTWQEANTAGKEYHWKQDSSDGLRSYSFAQSNPAWNYSTEPDSSKIIESDEDDDGAYRFSDSSTGQPSARRGNLYNWTAATLGSSYKSTSNQQAPDSICPYGWQLPATTSNLSASTNQMTNKSFVKLLGSYGVRDYAIAAGFNRLAEWPLQYLPTGHYNYGNGFVAYRTANGGWWSGVATSATYGHYLLSSSTEVHIQWDYNVYGGDGLALREVARVINFRFL